MRLLCFLTLSRKRHSITSAMFCWSHKPFLLQYVCVLVADVCVCVGEGVVLLHKSARRWESWPPHPPRTTLFLLHFPKCYASGLLSTPLILSQTQVSQPSPFHSPLPPQTRASQESPLPLLSPLSRPWSSWGAVGRAVLCWEDGPGVTVSVSFSSQ